MTHNPQPKVSFSDDEIFDYDTLNPIARQKVQDKTSELKSLIRRSAQDIVDIGQRLIEVRDELEYGNFRRWLKSEFSWSASTATKFIQVATQFSCVNFTQLEIAASALYLLARPSIPEEARNEALTRAAKGESITLGTAKEIVLHQNPVIPSPTFQPMTPLQKLLDAEPRESLETSRSPVDEEVEGPWTEHTTIDITAETITDDSKSPQTPVPPAPQPKQSQISHTFEIGDRVRILRRQNGQDKWSGYVGNVWEITVDGWLRVDVEGHQGVRFTLHPDWVELFEETVMTERANTPIVSDSASFPQEKQLLARIPLAIDGATIEVDGVIHDVEVHYTHQGIHGSVRVPANLIFPKSL
ncbi:MAG: DUF3102 domain-containing protein [Thermosynechococcaceae cyanobacterium]